MANLLIVSNERTLSPMVWRHLALSHDVTMALSAGDAFELLDRFEFDVILCDLDMNEGAGLAVHLHLQRTRPELAQRVILMAYEFHDALEEMVGGSKNLRLAKTLDLTLFELVVRRLALKARSYPRPLRRDAARRAARILYVEDSSQNRELVRRYLADDFDVLEAEDGVHGVERAVSEIPDLILMDLSLPRLDGWEATRRLKVEPKVRDVPVIALTGHSDRRDQVRARGAGCIDYLLKPIEREALIGTIRRYLPAA